MFFFIMKKVLKKRDFVKKSEEKTTFVLDKMID